MTRISSKCVLGLHRTLQTALDRAQARIREPESTSAAMAERMAAANESGRPCGDAPVRGGARRRDAYEIGTFRPCRALCRNAQRPFLRGRFVTVATNTSLACALRLSRRYADGHAIRRSAECLESHLAQHRLRDHRVLVNVQACSTGCGSITRTAGKSGVSVLDSRRPLHSRRRVAVHQGRIPAPSPFYGWAPASNPTWRIRGVRGYQVIDYSRGDLKRSALHERCCRGVSGADSRRSLGGKGELEFVEQQLQLGLGLCITREAQFTPIIGWHVNVDHLHGRELLEHAARVRPGASAFSCWPRVTCRQ